MPMYQYSCRSCEQEFEKQLRMSQSGETQPCPTCGSRDTYKRFGSISVSAGATPSRRSSPPATSPFT